MTDAAPQERTFVFVDLAGFSTLTEAHGDPEAAGLVERIVAAAATDARGKIVKSIGDAAKLAFPDPPIALDATKRLLSGCRDAPGFPRLRAGMHHGPAVASSGDWFGAAVNLAARVAAQAQGGQTLATAAVTEWARRCEPTVVDLGEYLLRNIADPVELFEIELTPPARRSFVVWRIVIDYDRAAGRRRHHDHDFWFCSLECAAAFATNPNATSPPKRASRCRRPLSTIWPRLAAEETPIVNDGVS